MSLLVDLDRLNYDERAALPVFIGFRAVGRTQVELFFKEDAEYIASLFKGFHDDRFSNPSYWASYDAKCVARLSPEKVLKKLKGKKKKSSYWPKYDYVKMMTCPRSHKCGTAGHVCRPISYGLVAARFGCSCRPAADITGAVKL